MEECAPCQSDKITSKQMSIRFSRKYSMNQHNYKYIWALSTIREHSGILQAIENGVTPEHLRAAISEVLSYYITDEKILSRFFEILIADCIELVQLEIDSWAAPLFNSCLETHLLAKASDAKNSLASCA